MAIDRSSAERIHKNDSQRLLRALEVYYSTGSPWSEHLAEHRSPARPPRFINTFEIGLTCDRRDLYERINRRCAQMLEDDLEGEVKKLQEMGYHRHLKAMGAIGYRHMLAYLHAECSWQEMADLLARDTRRYAKRQYTWFRTMEGLQWFELKEGDKIMAAVDNWLALQDRGE